MVHGLRVEYRNVSYATVVLKMVVGGDLGPAGIRTTKT